MILKKVLLLQLNLHLLSNKKSYKNEEILSGRNKNPLANVKYYALIALGISRDSFFLK